AEHVGRTRPPAHGPGGGGADAGLHPGHGPVPHPVRGPRGGNVGPERRLSMAGVTMNHVAAMTTKLHKGQQGETATAVLTCFCLSWWSPRSGAIHAPVRMDSASAGLISSAIAPARPGAGGSPAGSR